MKPRHVVVLAAAMAMTAIAGCATNPPQGPDTTPATRARSDDSEARSRARIHTELASSYLDVGNLGVALEEVNEALRADSSYGPAYNVAGVVYAELRDDRLAEQSFERALRIDPIDSDANNNYGRFLCDRKREKEAIKYFLAALRNPLYQTPDRSYVNAGLCARRQGDLDTAQDFFQRALKVRPFQPQALYQLADLAYARGDYPAAKTHLSRVVQNVQPSAELLWLALRVERRLGDRNAETSLGLQLRRTFRESTESRSLQDGQFG